uniref:Uncharacterized protein n=1 Tax=Avena sativa TaxID=4498 RepID=A0ACD5ZJ81_AVESA
METIVVQRPSPDKPKTVQAGDRMYEQRRENLVSWMDGLTRRFDLAPGTLHRAVSYLDRVLSARGPSTDHSDYDLGLLGAAAVFTAAKYEDRSTVSRLNAADVARCCGFATAREVVDTERDMLATLRYELGGPTGYYAFVDSDGGRAEQGLEIQSLAPAQLAADTSPVDDDGGGCLQLVPSVVAASTLFLAAIIVFAMFSELIPVESLVFQL